MERTNLPLYFVMKEMKSTLCNKHLQTKWSNKIRISIKL